MRRGSVSSLLLRPVVGALAGRPGVLAGFYEHTGLRADQVADPDVRVSPAQFCIAWAELTRLTTSHVALLIAEATPPGAFGLVEYVCRSAPTLREALAQWVRYLNLLDDAVEVALVEAGDVVSLRVTRESEAPAPASHELCFALVVAHARRFSSRPFRARAVHFAHPRPHDVAPYDEFFATDVRFDRAATELLIDRDVLAAPMIGADPALLSILTENADALARRTRGEPPMLARVKGALREALRDGDDDIDKVARRLATSARSLQRKLKDEGSSFLAAREAVRRELAERYLGEALSVTEVSFLLGFSEPSAFFRAFKRWTGRTPLEHRALVAGAG